MTGLQLPNWISSIAIPAATKVVSNAQAVVGDAGQTFANLLAGSDTAPGSRDAVARGESGELSGLETGHSIDALLQTLQATVRQLQQLLSRFDPSNGNGPITISTDSAGSFVIDGSQENRARLEAQLNADPGLRATYRDLFAQLQQLGQLGQSPAVSGLTIEGLSKLIDDEGAPLESELFDFAIEYEAGHLTAEFLR